MSSRSKQLNLAIKGAMFERLLKNWESGQSCCTVGAEKNKIMLPTVFLAMAVKNRPPLKALMFHSDRGIQYACTAFTNVLDQYEMVDRSMSRKGNCWDNAVAESYFKTIKTELIYRKKYKNRADASADIFEWNETWYNRNRRHSALGNLTIEEFENQLTQIKNAA